MATDLFGNRCSSPNRCPALPPMLCSKLLGFPVLVPPGDGCMPTALELYGAKSLEVLWLGRHRPTQLLSRRGSTSPDELSHTRQDQPAEILTPHPLRDSLADASNKTEHPLGLKWYVNYKRCLWVSRGLVPGLERLLRQLPEHPCYRCNSGQVSL